MIPFSPQGFEISEKKEKALALQVAELSFDSYVEFYTKNDSVAEMGS